MVWPWENVYPLILGNHQVILLWGKTGESRAPACLPAARAHQL